MTYLEEQYVAILAVCRSYMNDYDNACECLKSQRQEIERLKAENERLEGVINDQNKLCQDCKKSVKEFAEELKAKTMCITEYEDGTRILQTSNKLIDQSVKIFLTNY